jgi:peptide deformylase
MILPIYAYGEAVLRKVAKEIEQDYPELETLIANMWETMYNATGVGLAAPQVGKSIRLFIVDTEQILKKVEEKKDPENEFFGEKGIKKVFINAKIHSKEGEEWVYNEGCLSIPGIREDVTRPDEIDIEYYDQNFKHHRDTFWGFNGRVIQHEYDHIEGILFTDLLKPLKKRMLKTKLEKIAKGDTDVAYKIKAPARKK